MVVLVVSAADAALAPASDAAVPGVTIDARVDGKRVGESTEVRPIRLSPKKSALLVVEVTNNSSRPVDVRIVRLEGKVVGLTFFAYDTAVAMTVAPGAKGSRRFPLDLGGLDGQATGLIPGAVKLLDPERHVVAEETGVVDVRGSLLSVYGLFGIGIAVLTVVSFLGALIGLARHRLPQNRWRRALRFMTPGIGLGLLLNFTLSATRVFVPGVGRWLTIVVVSAAVFFGLGYLTPTPPPADEDEEDEEPLALAPTPVAPELAAPPEQAQIDAPPPQPELAAPPELSPIDAPVPQPELAAPTEHVPIPVEEQADEAAAVADESEAPPLEPTPEPPLPEPQPPELPEPQAAAPPHLPIVVPCYLPPATEAGEPTDPPAAPRTIVVPPTEP